MYRLITFLIHALRSTIPSMLYFVYAFVVQFLLSGWQLNQRKWCSLSAFVLHLWEYVQRVYFGYHKCLYRVLLIFSYKWSAYRTFYVKLNKLVFAIFKKLISNSWEKHKGNQYHDSDFIPDKTLWMQINIGFYIQLSSK